jgi:hypothetical protein
MARRIDLLVDEDDYRAIQRAMAKRQTWRMMPDADEGNVAGRVLAEICRGWMEMLDEPVAEDDDEGDEWKRGT